MNSIILKIESLEKKYNNPKAFKDIYEITRILKNDLETNKQTMVLDKADLLNIKMMIEQELNIK